MVANRLDPARYIAAHPDARLRSAEECLYHQIMNDVFEDPSIVLRNVGRWQA